MLSIIFIVLNWRMVGWKAILPSVCFIPVGTLAVLYAPGVVNVVAFAELAANIGLFVYLKWFRTVTRGFRTYHA